VYPPKKTLPVNFSIKYFDQKNRNILKYLPISFPAMKLFFVILILLI
jgi:hypothetical protein